ncbi:aminocyclopropane-1-carboxylate deaminase/D-cysteine desulfhydrase family protein [Simiduia litorea]|uniref:1-aminocyclopropane-1-carboxylate deaminase/D-cysteine desulfhydrase n=1 Tax=Simiduia litorea TaxID=1435348 RepID=UPI0036F43E61
MLSKELGLKYPPRIPFAHTPTPIQPLIHLQKALGVSTRLWVKRDDLTGSHLSGNKIRKLEFLVADAKSKGATHLITCGGVQSNHCRATALLAAQAGLKCHLLLRGDEPSQPDGNLLLDKIAGATISYYPSASFERQIADYFAHWSSHYAAQDGVAYCIPTGGSNGVGLWGYIACVDELAHQFSAMNFCPDHIVCATGSGGTQAGLTLGAALLGLPSQVTGVAVCDDARWFERKVKQDLSEWQSLYPDLAQQNCLKTNLAVHQLAVNTLEQYVGPGYAQAGPEIFELIKLVAQSEGLLLDPVYTAKAFFGMVEEVKQGIWQHANDVLFIHTGGVFGIFPQREQFQF